VSVCHSVVEPPVFGGSGLLNFGGSDSGSDPDSGGYKVMKKKISWNIFLT